MLMNRIETAVINSAARRGLQRYYEAPLLARLGGRVAGGRVLEIGCGSGEGTRLIWSACAAPGARPARIHAPAAPRRLRGSRQVPWGAAWVMTG